MLRSRKSKQSFVMSKIQLAVIVFLALSYATSCSTHSAQRDPRLTEPVKKVPPKDNYTLETATETILDNYAVIDQCNDQLKAINDY